MLDQETANWYLQIEKNVSTDQIHHLGQIRRLSIELRSPAVPSEEFLLDISKHSLRLTKYTLQNRVRKSIGLVRVDFDGPPHSNPDGSVIRGPHIHIYRAGFDLKWAFTLPALVDGRSFSDRGSLNYNLEQFFDYCNINRRPNIQTGFL